MKKFQEYIAEAAIPTSNYGSISYSRLADIKENFEDNFIDVNYRNGKTKTWNAKSLKEKINLTCQKVNTLGEDLDSDNVNDITRELSELRDEHRAYKHAKRQFQAIQERFANKKIRESAPPDKAIEGWIKANKARFESEYGEDYEQKLYGHAWQMFRDKKSKAPKKVVKEADGITVVRDGGKKQYVLDPKTGKPVEPDATPQEVQAAQNSNIAASKKRTKKPSAKDIVVPNQPSKSTVKNVGNIPTERPKGMVGQVAPEKDKIMLAGIKNSITTLRKATIYQDETIPPPEYFKNKTRIDKITADALETATRVVKNLKSMPKTNAEMSELAKNLHQAKMSVEHFQDIAKEIETYFRVEGVPVLFEMKDETITRVLELCGWIITMDKTTPPAPASEEIVYDYEAIFKKINEMFPALLDMLNQIKEEFKTIKTIEMKKPKTPSITAKPAIEEDSTPESNRLLDRINKFVDRVISKILPDFDRKFDALAKEYKIAL